MSSIALAGNPNSGKTTLFNALTGSRQFVGNWPGVTVEKKEGKTQISKKSFQVVDLPGIYSLSPYSNEEIVTRDYILNENPDVVVNIIDASNLERNLYLTTQLIELGVPVVVALNMMDVVKKKGEELSAKALSKQIGCPVCEISAITNTGIEELKETIAKVVQKATTTDTHSFKYSEDIQAALAKIKDAVGEKIDGNASKKDFIALKVLCDDRTLSSKFTVSPSVWSDAGNARKALEKSYDDDLDSIIAEQRYTWINSIIDTVILKKRTETISFSDRIDRVLTHKILAFPIFLTMIYAMYFICLNPAGPAKKLVGIVFTWVINAMIWSATTLTELGASPWIVSLVSDGIVYGVGLVAAFLPYLMVLFVFLAILEECGYMARVAFIMDRLFRRFGLSGKSFIPMILGTGCSLHAVASTRTIESEKDREMTIILAPFMPCATKMPVIILIAGLFTTNAFIAPLSYIISIALIIVIGIILKKTAYKGEAAPFVMELPEYKMPRIKNVLHYVGEKALLFIKKAGTIVLLSTIFIWALKYFTFGFQVAEVIDDSILATISGWLSPIFIPLGLGAWQLIAALLSGYLAKEQIVATLGVIYGVDAMNGALLGVLTPASAVSFILFILISSPCFSSIGMMYRELGKARLTFKAVGIQMGAAYIISLVAYQVLNLVF